MSGMGPDLVKRNGQNRELGHFGQIKIPLALQFFRCLMTFGMCTGGGVSQLTVPLQFSVKASTFSQPSSKNLLLKRGNLVFKADANRSISH